MTTRKRIPDRDIPRGPIPWRRDEVVLDGEITFTTSSAIQDAVDEATAGSHIAIGPGDFSESVLIDDPTNHEDLSINAAGRGTVVDGTTLGSAIEVSGVSGVTIRNIALKNTAGAGVNAPVFYISGVDANECTLENVYIQESDGHGIHLDDSDDHLVQGVIVDANVDGSGIVVAGDSADVILDDCKVFDVSGDGYLLRGNRSVLHGCWQGGASGNSYSVGAGAEQVQLMGAVSISATGDAISIAATATDTSIEEPVIINPGAQRIDDAGTRTFLNGRYLNPPTHDLGGVSGSITATDNELEHYRLKVDAGGSAVNLQGIDGIAQIGTIVTLIHAGGENVTLEHANGSASNPLSNASGADRTLTTNGELAEYVYDGTNWQEVTDSVTADPYTDEKAQDAVGGTFDYTLDYDDATPSIGVSLGSIALGSLGSRPHSALTGIGASDHHARYTDPEALSAVVAGQSNLSLGSLGSRPHSALTGIGASDHHARYTDEEARDAAGAMAVDGLSYNDGADELGLDVVATGSVQLAAGTASIDTGVTSATVPATFNISMGPHSDADLAATIRAFSGGNYHVVVDEIDTSINTPWVSYDIVRVR